MSVQGDPHPVLAALSSFPPLTPVGGGRVAVVGGFVRDVWLGREPRELDVVIEGDAHAFARTLGGRATFHERFGTATVTGDGWRIDVAQARRETYRHPGALPDVAPAPLEVDLERRDFTVNAFAVVLDSGEVLAIEHAYADLAARRLRALHEDSFLDDPTRVLRLARYAQRLDFSVETATAACAAAADMGQLSAARITAELRLALAEPDPITVLEHLAPWLPVAVEREPLVRALELLPAEADRGMLILGAVVHDPTWLAGLELTVGERQSALAVGRGASLAAALAVPARASELADLLRGVPVEAVAMAGGLGASAPAVRWLDRLRHVHLEISGADLLAAGVPEGPQIGSLLRDTLAAKLDGAVAFGREGELAFALRERGR